MIEIFALITACTYMVLITNGVFAQPFSIPRNTFLCVAGHLLLGAWLYSGPVIQVPAGTAVLASAMVIWWFVCAAGSERNDNAIRWTLIYGFSVFLGVFLLAGVEALTVIEAFTAMATLNALVAIIHNVFRIKLHNKIRYRKQFEPAGLIGNPNHLAAYLAPHALMAAHLAAAQSFFWAFAGAVILFAMWRTKCRAAFMGVGIGALLLAGLHNPIVFMLVLPFGGAFFLFNQHTLKERMNYWRVAVEQIRRSPVTGVGFRCWKLTVARIQGDIHKRTAGEFLRKENYQDPWPKLAHNDALQAVLDNGIPGLLLLGAVTATAVAAASGGGSEGYLILAVIAAIAGNGLFFHALHIPALNLVFWAMIGCAWQGYGLKIDLSGTLPLVAVLYFAIGCLVYRYIIKRALWSFYLNRYYAKKTTTDLTRCLRLDPRSTHANSLAADHCSKEGHFVTAWVHTVKAIEHYDGDLLLWWLYRGMGDIAYFNGAHVLANAAYNQALDLLPWDNMAILGKKRVEKHLDYVDIIVQAKGAKVGKRQTA